MKLEDLQFPFWVESGRPGASAMDIQHAEASLGRRLPVELTKALRLQDGGVSVYSGFRRDDYYVPMPAFFSVEAILQAEARRSSFGTPDGVVAIASGAHEWLGLDYRASDEPSVVFQESDDDDIETVATSFEELLAGLVED
jgi:hypothetical protein